MGRIKETEAELVELFQHDDVLVEMSTALEEPLSVSSKLRRSTARAILYGDPSLEPDIKRVLNDLQLYLTLGHSRSTASL